MHVFIISLCIQFYLVKPATFLNPREYVYRAVIICLRCCLLIALFGINGLLDVIIGLLFPVLTVLLLLKNTDFSQGSIQLIIPAIIVTLLGETIFNYLACESQVRMFANEVLQKDKLEEQMKIIDMFHGTVFIVDPIKN